MSDLPKKLISSCAAPVLACNSTEEKCFRQCDLDTATWALLSHRTTFQFYPSYKRFLTLGK